MGAKNIVNKITLQLRARSCLIILITSDENRALRMLEATCK